MLHERAFARNSPHVTRYFTLPGQSYPQGTIGFSSLYCSKSAPIPAGKRPQLLTRGLEMLSNSGFPARIPCQLTCGRHVDIAGK